jgi:hypothetical protein
MFPMQGKKSITRRTYPQEKLPDRPGMRQALSKISPDRLLPAPSI